MSRVLTAFSALPARPPLLTANDPGVTINFDYWPFAAELQNAVGGLAGIALILLVAAVVISGVAWAISRAAGAGKMQTVTGAAFLIAALAAVIIGSASGAIGWFSERYLGF